MELTTEVKAVDRDSILKKIRQLQKSGYPLTNGYTKEAIEKAEEIWESERAVLYAYDDNGVKRLIYYALDPEALQKVLKMPEGQEYVLDFLTRNPEENREIMENAGFQVLARMMRVSNFQCGSMLKELPVIAYRDDSAGYTADISEAHEIKEKMWEVFDTRVSHLLEEEELIESIRRKEICIHRNEAGNIDAFVQTIVQPKRFYFNQAYNAAGKGIVHALILKSLCEYASKGGEYVYAWVEENNVASLKFNGKYGMKHDGMWDMVYVRE